MKLFRDFFICKEKTADGIKTKYFHLLEQNEGFSLIDLKEGIVFANFPTRKEGELFLFENFPFVSSHTFKRFLKTIGGINAQSDI